MRKILAGLGVVALMVPLGVSAATAEELAAQIKALLDQVDALQKQVGSGQTQTQVQTGTATNPGGGSLQCPYISRVLKRGASGADVTRLQQFLALDPAIYPEAQVTGFYGALTESAVKRFQCKNKLVCDGTPDSTGYGVTGPRTAALLALQCPEVIGSNSGTPSGFIRVTPTSGAAPLAVQVQAILNTAKTCNMQQYEVYFGDAAQPVTITVPAGFCNEMTQTLSHTYTRGGIYGIVLRSGVHQNTINVTVTGGSSGGGGSGGNGPFSVTAGVDGDPFIAAAQFDIASSCARYDLDWGDGSSHATQNEGSCSGGTVTKTLNHTYDDAGSYTITLKRGSSLDTVDTVSLVIVD
jgi:peptidoglycan hydrolase-like protein with peptidoglycan-binding domain